MIEGLGNVQLEVADLERSVAFYRDGLRFRCDVNESDPAPTVIMRAGDLTLVLIEKHGAKRARNSSRGKGVVLTLAVAGVDVYRDALVARGVRAGAPRDVNGHREFTVRDPDGYSWCFVRDDE